MSEMVVLVNPFSVNSSKEVCNNVVFFCFLFHTITENPGLLFFISLFWPISALVMLISWLENLFEDKLEAFLKKSLKKIDEKYREERQKIGID